MTSLVRDAMVPNPHQFDADASAQEAGEALMRPEVRAALVVSGGELVGVLSRSSIRRRLQEDEPPEEVPGAD